MNKAFIGAAIALGVFVTGCNNAQGVFPVGIPTVIVSLGDSFAGKKTEGGQNGQPATTYYEVSGTLDVRSQKGSPAGTIISFKENGVELLSGPFVEACPITSDKDCGPFSKKYTLRYDQDPIDVRITSVVLKGLNGNTYDLPLGAPVILR
jgi:hypothetical protein